MRRKFIRTLVAVLAAIAVFGFVYPDDLLDYDVAGQSDIVMKLPEKLPTHRDQQAIPSSLLTALRKSTCSLGSDASARLAALVSLSTSVLRC
jgi:hypothetical protein